MKNLIAATYAPMHKESSLNLNLIKSYGIFLKSNKVSGAFVNGSTGDFVSLSTSERKELIEAWAANRPDDFLLINQVGHTNLREAKELARHSAGMVDAICTLAPFYFRPKTLESLLAYCKEIADSAPGIPFYYYHIPVLTGASFQMIDFMEKAVDEIPNFAGIKYTQDNLSDFGKCINFDCGTHNILFGVDEMLVSSLPLGATGWVGSTYNHLAPLYYKIISLYNNGQIEKAGLLQEKAVFFVETLDRFGGFNGAGKSFMRILGLDMGPSRFPHTTLTDRQLNIAMKSFEKEGLLPYFGSKLATDFLN